MSNMPSLCFNDMARLLQSDGWEYTPNGATGHKHMVHPDKPGKVTLDPHLTGDICIRVLRETFEAAGLYNAFKRLQHGTPLRVLNHDLRKARLAH